MVHEHHGIGRFAGVVNMQVDGADKDYIKICYAGTDVLYVPATQLNLVSKYVGGGDGETGRPMKLSKMGGADWARTKTRTKAAVKNIAKELTALYAARQQTKGFAFSPDSEWQVEFEERFEYPETDCGASRKSRRIWKNPRLWTACCAETWGSGKRKSPCVQS